MGGFPTGMDLNVAGIPWGWIWQLWDSCGLWIFFRHITIHKAGQSKWQILP